MFPAAVTGVGASDACTTAEVRPPHDFNSFKSRRLPGDLKMFEVERILWTWYEKECQLNETSVTGKSKLLQYVLLKPSGCPGKNVLLMGRNLTMNLFFWGCTNIGVNSWITCQPHLVGDSGWPYLAPGESRWKVCSFRQRNPTSSGGCCKTLAPW